MQNTKRFQYKLDTQARIFTVPRLQRRLAKLPASKTDLLGLPRTEARFFPIGK